MRQNKIPLKNKRKKLIIALISFTILALFLSGYSLGKEYKNVRIEASSKITQPILKVENNPVIEISGNKEKEYCLFKVKNYKENGEITQIALNYCIEILSKKQESISFKLYKNEQEVDLVNNKTSMMRLEAKTIQEDNYQLEILYDKNKDHSVGGGDIIQDVKIKIYSEQIKS